MARGGIPPSPLPSDGSLRERLHILNVASSAEATALAGQGQRATYGALVVAPFSTFIRVYFRRGEWRRGTPGLIAALFAAYGIFVRYTKLWEQQNVKTTVPPPQT